jgi:hypothetical protein
MVKKHRYTDALWPLATFLGRLPEPVRKDALRWGQLRSYER